MPFSLVLIESSVGREDEQCAAHGPRRAHRCPGTEPRHWFGAAGTVWDLAGLAAFADLNGFALLAGLPGPAGWLAFWPAALAGLAVLEA